MKRLQKLLAVLVVALPLAGMAQPVPYVSDVAVETTDSGSELLKFNANTPVEIHKVFTLAKPDRVVIDISTVKSARLNVPKSYKGKLLKSLRFGQFDASTSRLVLDVARPAKILASQGGAPFMVEIAAVGEGKATISTSEARPLIVIDAGHGGQDPGALGANDTHEKDVTLNYARALRDGLVATGRYRVKLTREDDRFIMLHDRVDIARKAKGDIFISLHADSNPRADARGLSIYTLSENASDDEAAALAERENKVDIIPGIDLNTADPDVASILIDLTQRETMNKSSIFAEAVVASLRANIRKLDKTHRYAGFRVLKAPDIPSVLVELGFLSNPHDERLLLTKEHRDLVVESIIKGIDRYRAAE
jgi:N-acetylmuramoyl-L-alanine amidase